MKNKYVPILLILMCSNVFCLANTGGKDKKEDPDMNGIVLQAETGKPLKNVNVTAYNNAKKEKSVTSDANGNFALVDLKPGTYRFVFQKEGFEKVIREKIVLKLNEGYQLTIQMSAEENIFDLMPSPLLFNADSK